MKEKKPKFDVKDAAMKLWRSRRTLLWWCGGMAVFGIVMAISTPKRYSVTSALAPEQTGVAGISSLASMIGVNLNGMESTDAVDPSLFPDIAETLPFLMSVAGSTVRTEQDTTTTTYIAYLRRKPKVWYGYITHAPAYLRELITKPKGRPDVGGDEGEALPFIVLGEKEYARLESIAKDISVSQNAKTSIITVTVTDDDPLVATMLNANVLDLLQEAIVDYKTNKATADLAGYRTLSEQLYAEYHERQQAYADFVSKNRSISNEYINAERDRLQSEMELTLASLQQITQQRYLAEATLVEKKPAFAILNPPSFPFKPVRSRSSVVIGWFMLGLIISVLWVLYGRDYWNATRRFCRQVRNNDDKAPLPCLETQDE